LFDPKPFAEFDLVNRSRKLAKRWQQYTANHSHFCSKCDEVCPEIVCVWFLTAFVSKDKWGKDEAPIVDWDEVKQAWTDASGGIYRN